LDEGRGGVVDGMEWMKKKKNSGKI